MVRALLGHTYGCYAVCLASADDLVVLGYG